MQKKTLASTTDMFIIRLFYYKKQVSVFFAQSSASKQIWSFQFVIWQIYTCMLYCCVKAIGKFCDCVQFLCALFNFLLCVKLSVFKCHISNGIAKWLATKCARLGHENDVQKDGTQMPVRHTFHI